MSSVPTCLSIVQFAVAAVVLFFGLGWLLLPIAFRRGEFTPIEKIPVSFSLSVGSIAVIGVMGHFLGLGLKAVQYVIALLLLLLLLWRGVCWRTNWRNDAARQAHRKSGGSGQSSGSVTLDQPTGLFGKLSSLRQTLVAACSRPLSRPDIVILIFAAFCSLLAFWQGPWLSHTADSFYHLASARRLIDTQGVLPRGAFVAYESEPSGIDPTAGTWHLVLALLSVFSSVDLTWIWFYLPAILAPVLVLALYSFTAGLFKNQSQATFATILYFLLEYNLDFRVTGQPNCMGFALLWIALLFAARYLDNGKLRFFGLTALFGLVLGTLHFTIFEFFLASIGAYALFYALFSVGKGVNSELGRVWAMAFVPLLFSLPIVLYKALARVRLLRLSGGFSPFGYTLELGHGLYIMSLDLLFPGVVSVQTLSFILLLLLIPACWKRDRASIFLFSNMLIVPLIMFNPVVVAMLQGRTTELLLTRLPLMLPYPLVVGFLFYQWGTISLTERWALQKGVEISLRAFVFCVSLYILLSQVSGNLIQLYSSSSDYKYSMSVSRSSWLFTWEDPYEFMYDNIPRDAVIVTDPVSSYYIGGLTGRFVIALPRSHTPPGIPDAGQRVEGSLDILDQNADLKTTVSLLRKWGADYIFVDLNAPGVASLSPRSKFERYSDLFREIYDKGDVSIYEYNQEALALALAEMDVLPENCLELNVRLTDDLILASSCFDDRLIEADKYIALKLGWKPLRQVRNDPSIEFKFSGANSGHAFSATFDLGQNAELPLHSWEPNSVYEEAYITFMPADVALDAYEVSIKMESQAPQEEVVLGQFGLRETYQAKFFRGITRLPENEGPEDYSKYSGWVQYQDYAITRDLGAIMLKDIHPIPPGGYEVLLKVYNHENQGVNQVEVTLNGSKRVIEWDGSKGGEEWVGAVFDTQGGGSELSITSLKREQWYIVISEVAIVPLIEGR
jgi:hypothetical protein